MKQFIGTVVSNKMNKTVVVKITNPWTHPLYKKTITKTKKYLVHDEMGAKVGDQVKFTSTKPISKRKKFKVTEIIKK